MTYDMSDGISIRSTLPLTLALSLVLDSVDKSESGTPVHEERRVDELRQTEIDRESEGKGLPEQ